MTQGVAQRKGMADFFTPTIAHWRCVSPEELPQLPSIFGSYGVFLFPPDSIRYCVTVGFYPKRDSAPDLPFIVPLDAR